LWTSAREGSARVEAAFAETGFVEAGLSPAGEDTSLSTEGAAIGPNRNESMTATGRAPIVKMSRRIPPTPVAAP